ncbi:hypothetical protein [Rathayibacter tanaceti]|uniref:Uncharacterized protein n=1 Tax=Rathayibacter tanaceti TaxID=1671680 RepID=A0AAE6RM14_9MICO|nr:hypothetical protein [Rathayibacter tanaceti]QHC56642.1 hypothetical protein GSU10_14080 [Rathayibacter tanaceti]
MTDLDRWGVLTEGVVQKFPSRGAARRFQDAHAEFWGRRSPPMIVDGERWVEADQKAADPSEWSGRRLR